MHLTEDIAAEWIAWRWNTSRRHIEPAEQSSNSRRSFDVFDRHLVLKRTVASVFIAIAEESALLCVDRMMTFVTYPDADGAHARISR